MFKLDQEQVARSQWGPETIPLMQVAIFVMCGGGFLGHMAAEQPRDFYIDDRAGRLPYSHKEIYQAVNTFQTIARTNGIDIHQMPEMLRFHNMGVF